MPMYMNGEYPPDNRPTHIIDHSGDRKTRCGKELFSKSKAGYPVVLAAFVQAHIDGHEMPVCEVCAQAGWPT